MTDLKWRLNSKRVLKRKHDSVKARKFLGIQWIRFCQFSGFIMVALLVMGVRTIILKAIEG